MVSGNVFGKPVRLRCAKRSAASCRAMLRQAASDEFHLERASELEAPGSSIIYVGASFGAMLIGLALRFPEARLEAVEAEPVVYRYLTWNVRENGLADRVKIHNLAIVGEQGPESIKLCVHYARASRSAVCGGGSDSKHVEQIQEVPAAPLSRLLLPSVPQVELLLLDCEGCEAHALDGDAWWNGLRGRVRRVCGELHYSAFAGRRSTVPPGEPDTALVSRSLDVAVALEAAESPGVPTRIGRKLFAEIFGEHLPAALLRGGGGGAARPTGAEDFSERRIFVYDLPPSFHADLLHEVRAINEAAPLESRSSCDYGATPCTERGWTAWYSTVRQLGTEVVVLQKLLLSPLLVDDPRKADFFVVPYFHALDCRLTTWRMHQWAPRCRFSDLPHDIWARLPHYSSATASRHIFLSSTEPHNMHITFVGQPQLMSVGPRFGDGSAGHVLVPTLVTDEELQPGAFRRHLVGAPAWEDRPVEFLFVGSTSNIWRRLVVEQLERYRSATGPDRVVLDVFRREPTAEEQFPTSKTIGVKRAARFCPCPPGDVTSVTVRFFDALLSGCIPVVISFPGMLGRPSWFRNGGPPVEWSYPWSRLIQWHDTVVEVPVEALRRGQLVEVVRSTSTERLAFISDYIVAIRHLLVFDWEGSGPDAFTALFTALVEGGGAADPIAMLASPTPAAMGAGARTGRCSCLWLPGKMMPRAKHRWWSHVFSELYCFEAGLPEAAQGKALGPQLVDRPPGLPRSLSAPGARAPLHVVASPGGPCEGAAAAGASSFRRPPWLRAAVPALRRYGVLPGGGSAGGGNRTAEPVAAAAAAVFVYGCGNGTSVPSGAAAPRSSASLPGLPLYGVPFRRLVQSEGKRVIADSLGKFKIAEARDDAVIRMTALSTIARFSDPPPSAAIWMYLLSALSSDVWPEATVVFINSTAELIPSRVAQFLGECFTQLGKDPIAGGCLGIARLAANAGRTPCSTVWRVVSGTCSLPPLLDGTSLSAAVLAPPLLRQLPEPLVRGLATMVVARKAVYEALSDAEVGDLLMWLLHFPALHGRGSGSIGGSDPEPPSVRTYIL
mmetsp:Transcript_178621/g.566824  ORF Transcript_178621/g.566824 Transcript_178621/m.566824 type:complete len:1064 (+) Transcript_178621:1-3192(+)